jgi:RNA recognition motif-containing protein
MGSTACPFLIDLESTLQVEKLCQKDHLVAKKVYIGNLTHSVTHVDLAKWFVPFGTVQSAHVVQDREMGRSKGFGFVEMDTDAQADAAIQGLNDQEHDGRRLVVSVAKSRVARTVGLAGARGGVN